MNNTLFIFKNTLNNIGCPICWFVNLFNISFYVWILIESFHSTVFFLSIPLAEQSSAETLIYNLATRDCSFNSLFFFKGCNRIGPHSKYILSIIFGSLLGKGEIEIKKDGARIIFFQEAMHVKYLLWLHNQLAIAGYCETRVPEIGMNLGKKGKLRKTIRFSTWTFTSFNWISEIWRGKGVKVIPHSIGDFLTPLALAIWVMDSGVKSSQGLTFVNSYTYSDCVLLVKVLHKNFGLKASIQYKGVALAPKYSIFIPKEAIKDLRNKVSTFILPEMKYKLLS